MLDAHNYLLHQKDMDNQNKKQQPKEERQEKMSSTFKVAMTTVVVTLLLIAILLLLILFGMKKCASNNQSGTSSEQPIDAETNAKINKSFLDMVERQMFFDGYDTDELKSVVAVSYKDEETTFDINIIASSDTKVYFYYGEDVNKTENVDFVSYLLDYDTNQALDGNVSLALLDKTTDSINTSKTSYKAVVSKDASDNKYASGFTYEDNCFFIYQKRLITEGNDPFTGVGDQKISSGESLFDYYHGLLIG